LVARISWVISAAASRLPWRSDCLLRAIAAVRWLRRLKLRPDFYLGATKDANGVFKAHAWLYCGDVIVTGGSGESIQRC
jgi:hypothetical protein